MTLSIAASVACAALYLVQGSTLTLPRVPDDPLPTQQSCARGNGSPRGWRASTDRSFNVIHEAHAEPPVAASFYRSKTYLLKMPIDTVARNKWAPSCETRHYRRPGQEIPSPEARGTVGRDKAIPSPETRNAVGRNNCNPQNCCKTRILPLRVPPPFYSFVSTFLEKTTYEGQL